MIKTSILSLVITIAFVSCKNSEKGIDKIEIEKQYYNVLDSSSYSGITTWFSDSLMTIEGEYEEWY